MARKRKPTRKRPVKRTAKRKLSAGLAAYNAARKAAKAQAAIATAKPKRRSKRRRTPRSGILNAGPRHLAAAAVDKWDEAHARAARNKPESSATPGHFYGY